MLCEVPLTKEQQEFAAEHHGLVYKFLNDNHLSEDEFYDVVIFPYLTAVRDYCNSSSAQKYSFSTIAMRQMKFRLCDYFRAQERHKRNAEILSIHLGLYPDGTPLENTLAVQDKLMQEFEMGQLLHDLAMAYERLPKAKSSLSGVSKIFLRKPMWCFWNSAASNLPRREIKIILNGGRIL